jgi:hypothetical protein
MADVAFDPITAGLQLGGKLIDHFFPNAADADAAKLKLFDMYNSGQLAQLTADTDLAKVGGSIILAEANSQSWLARNWRPISMLVFVGLIVARWLGWAAPNLQEAEYLKLWDIVQFGFGGYIVGRSAEKIAPALASAITGAVSGNK